MIIACLTEDDGTYIGDWCFDALPRIGEQIVIPADRYEVIGVKHWPAMKGQPVRAADETSVRLRIRLIPAA
jgi:hypothetical protein